MLNLKRVLYGFLIFLVILIIAIVVVANSSWLIKKAADKFAPDYNITYDDITGNVFTGVKISGLKFDGKTLSKNVKFLWNPSKILYKRVAINEISVHALDVDVVKALIASFPSSDDNSTSEPLPIVILVDKVHLDVKPFEEQGIMFSKTVLDAEDIKYASDELDIENLALKLDTNVTKIILKASLDDGKLVIDTLAAEEIDSVTLENMFLTKESNATETQKSEIETKNEKNETLNSLIPKEVEVKQLLVTLLPRLYKSADIVEVKIEINALNADIEKIMSNSEESIAVTNFSLLLDSNVSHIDISGHLKAETLTFENVDLKEINTLALQALFVPETNANTVENMDENHTAIADDKKAEKHQEVNHLIPKYVVLKSLTTEIVPAKYDPVNIVELLLRMKNVKFDTQKLVVEEGDVDLNGTTNLSNIRYQGKIKDNEILGDIVLSPNEALFTLYKLPIRKDAIGDININVDASKEHIVADMKAQGKQLLIVEKSDNNNSDANASKAFNIDLDSLLSHVVYTIADNTMVADTKIMLTTPYAKDISIINKFIMDKNISYEGEIKSDKLVGIDANMVKPLDNLHITYSGNLKNIQTDISSDGLKGNFVSSDFQKGHLHVETRKAILLDEILELPGELNGTKVNVAVDVPLDFAKITPLYAKAKITSNIINLEADIKYVESIQAKITSTIPDDSLLKNFDKNIKWKAVSPLVVNVDMGKKDAILKLKSKELSSDINYVLESGKVEGTIRLAGLVTDVKGNAEEKITVKAKVNSMKSLMTSIQSFYVMEDLPPVEGAIHLSVDIMKLKQADISLSSPKIIYHSDRKTEHVIEDVNLIVSADKSKVQLKSYSVTFDEMKIFSTKPSVIHMKEESIEIAPLWINDELQVLGTYNIKTKQGEISADATKLHIAHKMIDLDTAINIETILNVNKTSIDGKVTILGGNIHYDLGTKTYPSDSDIIIVQDMKKDEASPFMDNLSINVQVKTQEPLSYKQGPIDIQAKANIGVHKAENTELMVLGEVNIFKGGSYIFEGKRFVLDKSNIYLTGDPNKPLLDISVKYKALNHLITIDISGTPATPNIVFSSVPSLTREQILSIILFDSEGGAGTHSGDDMMKMMGGAMAKSALSDMGIKLDHLAIGTDGSVEVGKKLTDKITFIYINDEIPQVRVKYQHSPRWESVISADEESEAYDIMYKKDFSEDDIIMLIK